MHLSFLYKNGARVTHCHYYIYKGKIHKVIKLYVNFSKSLTYDTLCN